MTYDQYKQIDIPDGIVLECCPVCLSAAEIWRHSESPESPTTTSIMCANGDAIGPQIASGMSAGAGCLLYMPPHEFYQGTIREAAKYWNAYAKAVIALRIEREKK